MEQDQCWIQTKRKYSMSNSNNLVNPSNSSSCYGDSWEEQAFAEDAAGASLGGCVWPPRSYSCSFCRREFRSAQALGGHMNVHRKDRARLKESSSPQNEKILHHHHHHELENHLQKPIQGANSLAYNNLFPNSSLCGLVYKTSNPNYDLDFVASTSSPSPSKTLSREETLIPFYDSSTPHKMISPLNSFEPWRNLSGDDRLCPTNFQLEVDNIHEKVSKGILDSRFRGKESNNDDDDEGDVAMSLNLVLCRAHPFMEFESTKEEEDFNCKKRKKIDCSSNQLFSKSSSFDRQQHIQAKMFELSPNSIEELDLELRLGTKSKV